MMKKLLVLLLSATMALSMVACGGDDTTADVDQQQVEDDANADVSGDYTEEQQELIAQYEQMIEDYNAAIELLNATPELVEDTEFVDMINETTESIDIITEVVSDPENLTDEFMAELYTLIDNAYVIINRIDAYAQLLPILTLAGVGADADENTYWFACSEDETVGAMVILSADQTQNVYCIGEMVVDADGIYTINDEEGYTMSMAVEVVDDGLILTMQDGTEVGMVGAQPRDVVEAILSIQENTENVNE